MREITWLVGRCRFNLAAVSPRGCLQVRTSERVALWNRFLSVNEFQLNRTFVYGGHVCGGWVNVKWKADSENLSGSVLSKSQHTEHHRHSESRTRVFLLWTKKAIHYFNVKVVLYVEKITIELNRLIKRRLGKSRFSELTRTCDVTHVNDRFSVQLLYNTVRSLYCSDIFFPKQETEWTDINVKRCLFIIIVTENGYF